MGYNLENETHETQILAMTLLKFENVILHFKKSQLRKYCLIPLICNVQERPIIETETKLVVIQAWHEERWLDRE